MFKFLYNFLFIDQATKEISHTKFWSNIGYGIMSWGFLSGTAPADYMLYIAFGAIVIGNRTAKNFLMKNKEK